MIVRHTVSILVVCMTAAAVVWTATEAGSAEPRARRPVANASKPDITQPGTYVSGPWKYRLIVTSPGSKSEGTKGQLFYGGKPVEESARFDYYRTPWGDVQWVGSPGVLWGEHGWVLRQPGIQGGRELPEPLLPANGPLVMVTVLHAAGKTPQDTRVEPWMQEEMRKLGVHGFGVDRPWFPLTDQAVTLCDTKLHGTLTIRLLPARDAGSLTVVFDGTQAGRIELPRKDGATKLVLRTLDNVLATQDFYLAFRVDRAASESPRPLVIGPESNGKEVVVQGTKEVVIGLPGDKRSGCVWIVKRVQGDAPTSSSVAVWGEPQFTPALGAQAGMARNGTFENVLRVTGVGKSDVELEYRRTWQTDKPPEKTYRVTLDVRR